MENKILGLHHITAIAGSAQRNYEFYTKTLGLRLVKKTVNFDDPRTYHFYFGNERGTPGTLLTFFPWEGIRKGTDGSGMATEIGYAIPEGSIMFWKQRLEQNHVSHDDIREIFGEKVLAFRDPDGLNLKLVESKQKDEREGWHTPEVNKEYAIKGFHSVTLSLRNKTQTAAILTEVFGYRLMEEQGSLFRYQTDAVESASIVDVLEAPQMPRGINGGGTNHHVAFRVKDEDILMKFREKIVALGLHITEKIDRNYFYSLYFREPGGVLFEIATDNPGFETDETLENLGKNLRLPEKYENARAQIEKALPQLKE